MKRSSFGLVAALTMLATVLVVIGPAAAHPPQGYEVWASDQSNSVAGEESRGVNGSFIWVWDNEGVTSQISGGADAAPLGCAGTGAVGPCDVNLVFPADLVEHDHAGPTGEVRPQIGRLHGMLVDPQNLYVNANLFNPGGGFVGIIDGRTKEAVALFRVSGTSAGRSNHMSFWSAEGNAILIANLNGKILERIDIERDSAGNIVSAVFNSSAGLGVGQSMTIDDTPKVYLGANAAGNAMIGSVAAGNPDIGDLTPNGYCRENGCASGPDGSLGGRPNNLIICPIVSRTGTHVAVTLAAGGLLMVDYSATPMAIVGEYGNEVINGAGCGGDSVGDSMFLNAGVSASAAGATHSTFTIYELPMDFPAAPGFNTENSPAPTFVYEDPGNTTTNGNVDAAVVSNETGQLPGLTTRRDSHGMVAVGRGGSYVHTVDRIQNTVDVVGTLGGTRLLTTYDLTTGYGDATPACEAGSVADDPGLPTNDPAPDLMDVSPNGDLVFIAFRGPAPVSVTHAAQGSCPGVGVVALTDGGVRGVLVTVLRSTNTVDTAPVAAPGGHDYTGAERSDVHGVIVRTTVED